MSHLGSALSYIPSLLFTAFIMCLKIYDAFLRLHNTQLGQNRCYYPFTTGNNGPGLVPLFPCYFSQGPQEYPISNRQNNKRASVRLPQIGPASLLVPPVFKQFKCGNVPALVTQTSALFLLLVLLLLLIFYFCPPTILITPREKHEGTNKRG